MATLAPSAAKAATVARPMPLLEPVTMATRSFNPVCMSLSLLVSEGHGLQKPYPAPKKTQSSPAGTRHVCASYPPLKRRAIFIRPADAGLVYCDVTNHLQRSEFFRSLFL